MLSFSIATTEVDTMSGTTEDREPIEVFPLPEVDWPALRAALDAEEWQADRDSAEPNRTESRAVEFCPEVQADDSADLIAALEDGAAEHGYTVERCPDVWVRETRAARKPESPSGVFGTPPTTSVPSAHRHDKDQRACKVPKNQRRLVDAVFENATACRVYRYDEMGPGENGSTDIQWAKKALYDGRSTYLYWAGGERYTVHVHSNNFYTITSKPLPEIRAELEAVKLERRKAHTTAVVPSTNGVVLSGKALAPEVREVLEAATVEGHAVKLNSGQLDRPTYEKVNEVLARLGGKWNRKAGGHVFPSDPTAALAEVLEGDAVPEKNPLAYFPTPYAVACILADEAVVCGNEPLDVLEPSAGDGQLVEGVRRRVDDNHANPRVLRWSMVEIDPKRVQSCTGGMAYNFDFLAWDAPRQFDRVIMNPPFTTPADANAYVAHILKAWSLLKPGGRLVAVVPRGALFRQDRATAPVRDLVTAYGYAKPLPDGSFEGAGTGVVTSYIVLDKPKDATQPEPTDTSPDEPLETPEDHPDDSRYSEASPGFSAKLERFASLLESQQHAARKKSALDAGCTEADSQRMADLDSAVRISPGQRYTKVDIGGSGRYMVVNATGEIFGIKGYGVIHRGHPYGTLDTVDQWDWSDYRGRRKP
jgi:hypothetical protein